MKKKLLRVVRWAVVLLLIVIAGLVARGLYAFRDRSPGYALDLRVDEAKSRAEPRPFRAGFGREKINPDLSDPKRPVWLAGFSQHRAATGLHDDLWAVAAVFDDGYTRFGVVALDAIGFFHDDTIAVRRACASEWKLDYTIVCSLHNHSTPDLMGLWGPNPLKSGVDPRYRKEVIAAAARALGKAVAALQPACAALHEIPTPAEGLVADTRRPFVFDGDIRVMHFTSAATGATLGTLVGWGNHPETPWADNTEITADYCGVLRDTLEHGFSRDGQLAAGGIGGVHLFVNGAVGGLMTTHPRITVRDPYVQQDFKSPSHEKSRAVGHQLAARILARLAETNAVPEQHLPISIRARTIEMPIENKMFLAAAYLGLIDRGHVRWMTMRTEVALVTLGDASVVCVPGEIYPEIVNGGIEQPPGADYNIAPIEVPPMRDLMPGRVKFVFGLANDELGYLIPKSEWDTKPPYLYDGKSGVYGEVNSCGPNAAAIVHSALSAFCRERQGPASAQRSGNN